MKKVNEQKKKLLEELINDIKNSKTVMIVSIENVPSLQFQRAKKELKDIARLKVIKKTILTRALNKITSEKKGIDKLNEKTDGNFAILFSDKDAFEISADLNKGKQPAKAKAGQKAPEEIVVEAGPTDLPAGPAISQLSQFGIKAGVEGGKIAIKEKKVIAKKGETITQPMAELLSTLDITPFSVGVLPRAAYDSTNSKIYLDINVDPEVALEKLKEFSSEALGLAMKIEYLCKDTVKFILAKASNEVDMLSKNLKN
ncbi:MAG: 50S ribosomal protein L10 [archaeon]|nr:MAG: 50S ribosomal protein L10 [archaeon]